MVYYAQHNNRSRICALAMQQGIKRFEPSVEMRPSTGYKKPRHDVAVFYGLAGGLRQIMLDYIGAGKKALYIDLGYWGRRKRTRYDGYHKIVVNDRHPTAYFQDRKHPADRLAVHGVKIEPWRKKGNHIVVVGMSAKAALFSGFQPHQWERDTIAKLRKLTSRPIIYRPKPNWLGAKHLAGSTMMKTQPLDDVLAGAHCVVAHHSNVAVEAILAGIPAICPEGVASVMASHQLEDIEDPRKPKGREQWAADIAYTQWSIDEMRRGQAWSHFTREGLI